MGCLSHAEKAQPWSCICSHIHLLRIENVFRGGKNQCDFEGNPRGDNFAHILRDTGSFKAPVSLKFRKGKERRGEEEVRDRVSESKWQVIE